MITLKHDRARFLNVVVQLPTRGRFALELVVNFDSVENEGNLISHDGRFGGLPLSGWFAGKPGDGSLAVEGAIAPFARLPAIVIVEYLDFVSAAEINATIGALGNLEFESEDEILKDILGDKIGAVFAAADIVDQKSVLDAPTWMAAGIAQTPSAKVLAIEEGAEAGRLLVGGLKASQGQGGEKKNACDSVDREFHRFSLAV